MPSTLPAVLAGIYFIDTLLKKAANDAEMVRVAKRMWVFDGTYFIGTLHNKAANNAETVWDVIECESFTMET
eukprot:1149291-Pelagomonas_calceolata.AAC.2